MNTDKTVRVMWLLNHTSARKFELQIMKRIGVTEVFTPKSYPQQASFRSASISYEEDTSLSIPAGDLFVLNAQDWYGSPSKQAWNIANKYFDILFFIIYKHETIKSIANNFNGCVLWRAYGMVDGNTHGDLATTLAPNDAIRSLKFLGRRFWFAQAYPHLHEIEPDIIAKRSLYLPLGMADSEIADGWKGSDKRIYFVCADIETNPYYKYIFESFRESFAGLPYAVAGAQAIQSNSPEVLGYMPLQIHERNMREFRLMFYHSTEPNHIHYHPFEAIRAGMPLVFMANGMLDRLGGRQLPGRCETIQEARSKIERILNDDWALIERIRESQAVLLEPMKTENCEQAWLDGFARIHAELDINRFEQAQRVKKPKRIAVIVPVGYRGGSLRGAKLLAQAIYVGSRQFNEDAEVVFLHLDDAEAYSEDEFADLFPGIKRRAFNWKTLPPEYARRAMRYAGHGAWKPSMAQYFVPDDGINQLQDCDLWLVISDRLSFPLLPLRPCMHMVYDYLQRYVPLLPHGEDQPFLNAARQAERILVSTWFTRQDALQYAGLPPDKVIKVPMLAPDFFHNPECRSSAASNYFVWTTNAAPHKNHQNALKALKWFYEELNGQLECRVTGVNTAKLLKNPPPYLLEAASLVKTSKALKKKVHWQGELPDREYQRTVAGTAFLWHAGKIDNGTFSVIEAAHLGVPALSSDYPAMREIDQQFGLNLLWMDAGDPKAMAEQLKQMELTHLERRSLLPSKAHLAEQSVDRLAGEYWKVVRECL